MEQTKPRDLKHLTRQWDVIPPAILNTPITIIGAGAIGSQAAVMLAKMGFDNLTVFDDDAVDVVNINSQFYRFRDIGKPKVEALQEIVEDFARVKIEAIEARFESMFQPRKGIVISAVDSMEARRMIFDVHTAPRSVADLVIDSRMGAEQFMMFAYQPKDPKQAASYEKSLYSDADSLPEPCTAKATTYCVAQITALVCGTVKSFLCNKDYVRSSQGNIPLGDVTSFMRKVVA